VRRQGVRAATRAPRWPLFDPFPKAASAFTVFGIQEVIMKNAIAMIAALLCVAGSARAERIHSSPRNHKDEVRVHNILFGLDTEVAVPVGNYADVNSIGGGPILTGEYTLTDTWGVTMRVGFQGHSDRTIGGFDSHVHSIPMLLGTKYYIGSDREGMFGAFEAGMFDLMSSVSGPGLTSVTSNDLKFGMGVGIGYQQDRWSARINLHTQDVGNFGNAFMVTTGIGYHFGTF
jgi:hypothetical protein